VYRARDARLQRDVAIKIVRDLAAGGQDRVARFQAQVLASLNHPQVIKESQGTTPGSLVVVKDWFDEIKRLSPSRR
jgi:serine/threonine protein kinase